MTLTPNAICRIYAMYEGRRWVISFVTATFFVEFGVNAWLMTHGVGTESTSSPPIARSNPLSSGQAYRWDNGYVLFSKSSGHSV